MARVGINGFGRIGRLCLRVSLEKNVDIMAINDANMNAEYMAYLFMYDSTHGRFEGHVETEDGDLIVNGKVIRVFSERDPKEIPWGKVGASIILECTGLFTTTDKASMHLAAGAKKVIISTHSPDAPMFVCGVNLDDYDSSMKVISNSSCSTNCAAPILKIIHETFCIIEVLMTNIHSFTSSQKTVDGPSLQFWRDGRGCQQNIIPAMSGAAKSIGKVYPPLCGKVNAMAFKVPVPNVSLVDLTIRLGRPGKLEDVIKALMNEANSSLFGILRVTCEDVVSSDFIGCSASAIVDVGSCVALTEKCFKIVAWYDNEYAYAHRMIDLTKFVYCKDMNA